MTDEQIYKGIQKYFDIRELVDQATYNKWRQKSWQFLCPRMLHTLLILREGIGKPITINNWQWNGNFDERGLRTNTNTILHNATIEDRLYLSAHIMGKAVDLDVKEMKAEEVRNWILDNEDLFPYKIRLEHKKNGRPINWTHIDCFWYWDNPPVYLFNI